MGDVRVWGGFSQFGSYKPTKAGPLLPVPFLKVKFT